MKTKTLFLLILLPLLCYNNVQAQEDVFPRDSAIWVINFWRGWPPSTVIYGLQGDTLINDISYQKLYCLNDSTLDIDDEDVFIAGIRQESQKVYVQPADEKDGSKFEEFLIYDFSANVEDTVFFDKKPYLNTGFEFTDPIWTYDAYGIITSIENGRYGKTFYIYSTDIYSSETDVWIEHIGSLHGLFFPGFRYPSGNGGPTGCELICMKDKENVRFLKDGCISCFEEFYKNIKIEDNNQNQIEVRFNSNLNNIIIKSFAIPSTFQLVSLDGKLLTSFPITETELSINASTHPKGIYIYKIVGENIFQSGKLIIK